MCHAYYKLITLLFLWDHSAHIQRAKRVDLSWLVNRRSICDHRQRNTRQLSSNSNRNREHRTEIFAAANENENELFL